MKNKTQYIRNIVGLLALLMVILPSQASAANVSMSLQPSSSSIQAGSNVTVEVRLALGGAKSLDAVGVVNYQADKLQYISASGPGTQGPDTSSSTGSYKFDQISTSSPFTGTVSVVRLTFIALASSGSTNLTISDASVGDSDSPPPAVHQTSVSGTTISFTAPPVPVSAPVPTQPVKNNTNSNNDSSSSNNQTATTGQPTEAEIQVNSQLDDEESVPVTTYTDQTGYPVAITVQDKDAQVLTNVEVTLGEMTAKTDSNGIASFDNVLAGEYVVSANGTELTIIVETGDPTDSQEFVLLLKDGSSTKRLFQILLGIGIVLLLVFLGFLLKNKLNIKRNDSTPLTSFTNTESSSDKSSDEIIKKVHGVDVPNPDEVIEPTQDNNV